MNARRVDNKTADHIVESHGDSICTEEGFWDIQSSDRTIIESTLKPLGGIGIGCGLV